MEKKRRRREVEEGKGMDEGEGLGEAVMRSSEVKQWRRHKTNNKELGGRGKRTGVKE